MSVKSAVAHHRHVEQAMEAPESAFANPADVVRDGALTRTEKIAVLKRWEQAEIDLQRAADEGMEGAQKSRLNDVNSALLELDPDGGEDGSQRR